MAPDFAEMYDQADFTKIFPMVHGTEKTIIGVVHVLYNFLGGSKVLKTS